MSKRAFQQIRNQPAPAEHISAEDLAQWRTIGEEEKLAVAHLQGKRQGWEQFLARKYQLKDKDQLLADGTIIRVPSSPEAGAPATT